MNSVKQIKNIWTIGHSTRSFAEFLEMLQSFNIQMLADVRRYPGSKRYPHFNSEFLKKELAQYQIDYIHYGDLGGRRTPRPDSVNTAWRHTAFRGYADYMESNSFQKAVEDLAAAAMVKTTAYMCSEAPWWRCHRSLISDFLKVNHWNVYHIMSNTRSSEHPYTSAASIINGKLSYSKI